MNQNHGSIRYLGQPSGSESAFVKTLYSKIDWRLLPLLVVVYMIAYLDRVNIGYAQLQMKQSLHLSPAAYGLGVGIFFAGYMLFEVPSNLILERVGVRKTLLRIMILWGCVAMAMSMVSTPTEFYIARFLLGVFEAGLFPGVILYLTYWYPPERRSRALAIFMMGNSIAGILAGPLCGVTLKYFDGVAGFQGWQWLFVLQGFPAVILSVIVYWSLPNRPSDAKWLTSDEKDFVRKILDKNAKTNAIGGATYRAFSDAKIYLFSCVYLFLLGAIYTVVFWIPSLIQSWGVKDVLTVGMLSAIPGACGAIGMVLVGWSSDRLRERRWHFAACTGVTAMFLWVAMHLQGNLSGSLAALSLAMIGLAAATPIFFALVSQYLSPVSAAAGIALVSTLGNLGPSIVPYAYGHLIQYTHNAQSGMYMVIGLFIAAGLLLITSTRALKGPTPKANLRIAESGGEDGAV